MNDEDSMDYLGVLCDDIQNIRLALQYRYPPENWRLGRMGFGREFGFESY